MQRALNVPREPFPRQVSREADAMRHWTARRRELLLADRLDRLTAALERLVMLLERRAA
jgi:hypothetical protein